MIPAQYWPLFLANCPLVMYIIGVDQHPIQKLFQVLADMKSVYGDKETCIQAVKGYRLRIIETDFRDIAKNQRKELEMSTRLLGYRYESLLEGQQYVVSVVSKGIPSTSLTIKNGGIVFGFKVHDAGRLYIYLSAGTIFWFENGVIINEADQ
jgi:hypothetical protein